MSLYGFVCWVKWETSASNGCLYSQISAERESYRWTDKGSPHIIPFPWVVQVWGVEVTIAKYTIMLRKRKAWCYSGRGGQVGSLEAQWTGCMGNYWLLPPVAGCCVHSLMDWSSSPSALANTERVWNPNKGWPVSTRKNSAVIQLGYWERFLHWKGDQAMEEAAQGGRGAISPGSVQRICLCGA